MHTIEVDFDVLKALMVRRPNETVSNNDVLRSLLDLAPLPASVASPASAASAIVSVAASAPQDWVIKGVRFAAGWQLRAKHHGREYRGRIEDGALVLDGGARFKSPSAAGHSITKYAVNGWTFWECRRSNDEEWRPLSAFRK